VKKTLLRNMSVLTTTTAIATRTLTDGQEGNDSRA